MGENRMGKTTSPKNKRRGWLIPIIIGALVIAGAGMAVILGSRPPEIPYTPEVTGKPNAVVDQPVVDHGDVRMEETVKSIFLVRNTGDQPLIILGEPRVELVQGCCPPRAIVSAMTVQPGQQSEISLTYTMHDMMGGPHEFRVHVLTNDPEQPEIALTALSNWVE